jgi:hypothetical protein
MRTAGHIALVSAGTLALATFVFVTVSEVVSFRAGGSPFLIEVVVTASGALLIGALAWVGTYFGARLAAPHQRTGRLARWLAAIYGAGAVLLCLPIKTHAVKLDMPPPSGVAGHIELWNSLLVALGIPLLVVIVALLTTRALAAALGQKVGRDA